MKSLNLSLIRDNIFKLLDYSGLTDLAFANILDISEKQLRLIKKKKANFNEDNINRACVFFTVPFSKLNTPEIEIDIHFRSTLSSRHQKNSEFHSILESTPTITFAIKYSLLADLNFKKYGFSTGEIKKFFSQQGWEYSSRYISLAMARNKDLIEIVGTKVERGRLINIYSARPSG
ncbi:hypothetical protein [Sphingobacterium siyangense]|jgi:hypothetical protein|uniref:hypothetical protein n=1 Tax=Sphingobacterium siyangense TaxID=459529 RepID=UPI003DA552BA